MKSSRRLVHFGIGSGLGAVFDYFTTLALIRLSNFSESISLALVMFFSANIVFLYQNHFTFSDGDVPWWSAYLRFMALALCIYFMRALLMELTLLIGLSIEIALALSLLIASAANYLAQRFIVFKPNH